MSIGGWLYFSKIETLTMDGAPGAKRMTLSFSSRRLSDISCLNVDPSLKTSLILGEKNVVVVE